MKTFTIEQIRKYIQSQDSLGDVLYKLSEANIDKANEVQENNEELFCENWQHDTCDCFSRKDCSELKPRK